MERKQAEQQTSAAHTPGPWTYDRGVVPPDGPQRYSTVSSADGDLAIAEVNDLIPEGIANARLIAAAPDLLAAAQTVLADLNARIEAARGGPVPLFRGIADLHAAIARATAADGSRS